MAGESLGLAAIREIGFDEGSLESALATFVRPL
jgi:hypothetical protein